LTTRNGRARVPFDSKQKRRSSAPQPPLATRSARAAVCRSPGRAGTVCATRLASQMINLAAWGHECISAG
jgi:hypothetical protein